MTKRVWVEHHMGMPISIHVRSSDPDHELVDRAVAAAYAEQAGAPRIWCRGEQPSGRSDIALPAPARPPAGALVAVVC